MLHSKSRDFSIRTVLYVVPHLIILFRTDDVGEMLSKVAEVMPNWIEVKTVVGIKYIKMLDKKLDPNLIESTCAEKIKSLKPTNPIKT